MALAAAAGAAIWLAACGDTAQVDSQELQDQTAVAAPPALPPATPSVVPDIGAAAISLGDVDNTETLRLITEETLGGCGFRTDQGQTVFTGGAPDDPDGRGVGVIDLNGRPLKLTATQAGGAMAFDGGPTLEAEDGTRVAIVRARTEPRPVGMESAGWPASMTVILPGGERRTWRDGTYICGV